MLTQDPQVIEAVINTTLLVCLALLVSVVILAVVLRPARRRGRHARRRTPATRGERA